MVHQEVSQGSFNLIPLLFLLSLGAAVLFAAINVPDVPDNIHTRPEHSNAKHEEAADIKDHMQKCGPDEIWRGRTNKCEKYYLAACVNGQWAVCIVQKIKRGFLERTSFVVKDGSRAAFYEWITAKATLWKSLMGLVFLPALFIIGLLSIKRCSNGNDV